MQVFVGLNNRHIDKNCVVSIGNFDGVHLGHQAVLRSLISSGKQLGLPSCVITFEPHPLDYFAKLYQRPELATSRILTLRDKLMAIKKCGIDQVLLLPFNASLANLSAQEFIEQILVKELQTRLVLVGDDFLFGHNRQGNCQYLVEQGSKLGFAVQQANSYVIDGHRVSSSMIRKELAKGKLQQASKLLGRSYCITGHIVHGRKLGRQLGFNTINQRFNGIKPATSGIFAVKVHNLLGAQDKVRIGVANFGVRPSLDVNDVNAGKVLLETHVLDWPTQYIAESEIYGRIIGVELLHKLRDELKYANLDELKQGIRDDIITSKQWFVDNNFII